MRRFLALLFAVFALSLAGCGTPSQDPDIQKHSGSRRFPVKDMPACHRVRFFRNSGLWRRANASPF